VRSGPAVIPSMNLLGAPAIALPNGVGENGLPTSIQLNAAPANEMLSVNTGIHYQLDTKFHLQKPPGFE
jgi:Asp-tRNA(Asn)/Glu-tRNA(Gln) amidotransferase A subunit family amidase